MTTPPATPPSSVAGSLRLLLVLSVVVLLLGLAERWLWRPPVSEDVLHPTASWIWLEGAARSPEGVAFYAVRDLDLTLDERRGAELHLSVDEEYLLWVNGRLLGSGVLGSGGAVEVWELEPWLRAGGNRLVVEARSRRGAGGILAEILLASGERRLVSDRHWRLFRRHQDGVLEGWVPRVEGEPPRVWGPPPTGRWAVPAQARTRTARAPDAAVDGEDVAPTVRLARAIVVGGGPDGEDVVDPAMLVDFGRPVEGVLELWLPPSEAGAYALDFGLESAPALNVAPPSLEAGVLGPGRPALVAMPGRGYWRDVRPRRFRWVRVQGLTRLTAARLDGANGAFDGPEVAPSTLFGIEPPSVALPRGEERPGG